MVNPNPGLITDEMWDLWLGASTILPGVKLSGIYANKKGYHNTVTNNLRTWPDNYSVKLSLDLVSINRNKARAIDLTLSDSEMVKWTTRMKNAAEDPKDSRLDAVKEFYGTLDNKEVFGLSKDVTHGTWRRVEADKTHLWHGHTSIFTAYVSKSVMLAPLLSVWAGQSRADWTGKVGLPKLGDSGEEVKYWQQRHNEVRNTVTPASPAITIDGNYGPATAAAFADFYHKHNGSATYKGELVTGWLAVAYDKALILVNAPKPTTTTPVDPAQLKALVDEWCTQNIPGNLDIKASLTGQLVLPNVTVK